MARTFRFQLESLLRLREFEEDKAKRQFLEILKVAQVLEQELMELVERREQTKALTRRDYTTPTAGGANVLDVKEMLRQQRYLNVLQAKMVAKQREILQYQPTLEAGKAVLREARRRRKVVDKIKERRRREWDLREARNEQKELDEIAQIYAGADKSSET